MLDSWTQKYVIHCQSNAKLQQVVAHTNVACYCIISVIYSLINTWSSPMSMQECCFKNESMVTFTVQSE